jgi:hypothetical protein
MDFCVVFLFGMSHGQVGIELMRCIGGWSKRTREVLLQCGCRGQDRNPAPSGRLSHLPMDEPGQIAINYFWKPMCRYTLTFKSTRQRQNIARE